MQTNLNKLLLSFINFQPRSSQQEQKRKVLDCHILSENSTFLTHSWHIVLIYDYQITHITFFLYSRVTLILYHVPFTSNTLNSSRLSIYKISTFLEGMFYFFLLMPSCFNFYSYFYTYISKHSCYTEIKTPSWGKKTRELKPQERIMSLIRKTLPYLSQSYCAPKKIEFNCPKCSKSKKTKDRVQETCGVFRLEHSRRRSIWFRRTQWISTWNTINSTLIFFVSALSSVIINFNDNINSCHAGRGVAYHVRIWDSTPYHHLVT